MHNPNDIDNLLQRYRSRSLADIEKSTEESKNNKSSAHPCFHEELRLFKANPNAFLSALAEDQAIEKSVKLYIIHQLYLRETNAITKAANSADGELITEYLTKKLTEDAQKLISDSQKLVTGDDLAGAIKLLEKIPAAVEDEFKSAQSLIIFHTIARIKKQADELKNQDPENPTLTEENLKLWIYHETNKYYATADAEGRKALRAYFPKPGKADKHFVEDEDAELVSLPVQAKFKYIKPNSWRPYKPIFWLLSAPIAAIPAATIATSQAYQNVETIYHNISEYLKVAVRDMRHGCYFDPSFPQMKSPLKYPLEVFNKISSSALGGATLGILVFAFLTAKKFGETKDKKYLIIALAAAAIAFGIAVGSNKITNNIYSRVSKNQTYNLIWSTCSYYNSTTGQKDPCAASSNCIYPSIDEANSSWAVDKDLDYIWLTPSAPNFLNSFFMSSANIILSIGLVGALIVLGVTLGIANTLTETVEYDDDSAPSVGYGTHNSL